MTEKKSFTTVMTLRALVRQRYQAPFAMEVVALFSFLFGMLASGDLSVLYHLGLVCNLAILQPLL